MNRSQITRKENETPHARTKKHTPRNNGKTTIEPAAATTINTKFAHQK